MRIQALSKEDRAVFINRLSQAGWDVESWDAAHEAGVKVDLAAEAEYVGPQLALRLEFLPKDHYLMFQVSQLDGELVLRLRLHPIGNLEPLLAQIIAIQDTLDSENHPSLVKSLIQLCDPLLLETDQGLFRLS